MQSQSFFVRTGDNGIAKYQLSIPVLDMKEGYSLRVKAEDGTDVACKADECGEYVIDRNDGPGQFKVAVAILDAQGTVCDERLIEISCSKGTDPAIMLAVRGVLEKQDARVMTVGSAFSDVHAKARGEDIAAVCEHYFRSDATADWRLRCLAYLQAAAGSAYAKDHAARIMGVISHALDSGDSVEHPFYAVNIGLQANVPPPTRFSFLSRALRHSFPNPSPYRHILAAIANITPGSERQKVAAVASELFAQYTDYALRLHALNVITAFGYRNALPMLRDTLSTTTDFNTLRSILQVLLSWNDTSSAPQLLGVLDLTNEPKLTEEIMQALKQFNYREAIPRIEQMIPVSGVDKAKALEAQLKGWR